MPIARTTTQLVARERELLALDAALAAGPVDGAVLALSGDPGIGKTTLLAELLARAGATGRVVLGGRAAELERDRPFGVIVEAVDGHLAGLRRQALGGLSPESATEL